MARINKTRFRTDYEQSFVLFKCFRGANTKQLDYYVVPLLVREKLRTMIIHMCSNEITKMNYENVNVEDLTQHVVNTVINADRLMSTKLQFHLFC